MTRNEKRTMLERLKGSLDDDLFACLEREMTAFEAEVHLHRQQYENLRENLEKEKEDLLRRLTEAHRRGADLASLYVATHRLHMTLDRGEVLEALKEIIASLVGCEEMAVFECVGEPALLVPVASAGVPAGALVAIEPGEGIIGRAALTGETWVAEGGADTPASGAALAACVPLMLKDRAVGVIALYRMLDHKLAIADTDLELFEALSIHAATALLATRPRVRAGEWES